MTAVYLPVCDTSTGRDWNGSKVGPCTIFSVYDAAHDIVGTQGYSGGSLGWLPAPLTSATDSEFFCTLDCNSTTDYVEDYCEACSVVLPVFCYSYYTYASRSKRLFSRGVRIP